MSRILFLSIIMIGLVLGSLSSLLQLDLQTAGKIFQGNNKGFIIEQQEAPATENKASETKQANKLPGIDYLLSITPPPVDAPVQQWVLFGNEVIGFAMEGKTFSHAMVWLAYIAKNKPEAFMELYKNRKIEGRQLEMLIQLGFIPDWMDSLPDSGKFLLSSEDALLHLATVHGDEKAKLIFIDAFFQDYPLGNSVHISMESIIYAISAMTEDQRNNILPHLQDGGFAWDPRDINSLLHTGLYNRQEKVLLEMIRSSAYEEKSMSSYILDGAYLGEPMYIDQMLQDAKENAQQPTNFYCAACYLALVTDGLAGSALLKAVDENKTVTKEFHDHQFILTIKD